MAIALSVHVLEDKRPRFDRRAIVATTVGWMFWSTLLLGAGAWSGSGVWPEETSPVGIVYPVVAVLGFLAMAWWKTRRSDGRSAAEKLKRYGAMWQSLYGAAWLMALGLPTQAASIGLFAVAGFAAMTIIKEFTGYSDRPLTYRI
jgi:hypothetical protein